MDPGRLMAILGVWLKPGLKLLGQPSESSRGERRPKFGSLRSGEMAYSPFAAAATSGGWARVGLPFPPVHGRATRDELSG